MDNIQLAHINCDHESLAEDNLNSNKYTSYIERYIIYISGQIDLAYTCSVFTISTGQVVLCHLNSY